MVHSLSRHSARCFSLDFLLTHCTGGSFRLCLPPLDVDRRRNSEECKRIFKPAEKTNSCGTKSCFHKVSSSRGAATVCTVYNTHYISKSAATQSLAVSSNCKPMHCNVPHSRRGNHHTHFQSPISNQCGNCVEQTRSQSCDS